MPPPTTLPATSTANALAPSRSRPQASRKRAHPAGDDAAYHGVASSHVVGTKRAAAERADGEPRVKRKRIEPVSASAVAGAGGVREGEVGSSLVSGLLSRHFSSTVLLCGCGGMLPDATEGTVPVSCSPLDGAGAMICFANSGICLQCVRALLLTLSCGVYYTD